MSFDLVSMLSQSILPDEIQVFLFIINGTMLKICREIKK